MNPHAPPVLSWRLAHGDRRLSALAALMVFALLATLVPSSPTAADTSDDEQFQAAFEDEDLDDDLDDLGLVPLTAGGFHTCAIDSDGDAYCWGRNDKAQLGNPEADDPEKSPVRVGDVVKDSRIKKSGLFLGFQTYEEQPEFKQLAAGDRHTCGLDENGDAFCWGKNADGQLGTGEFGDTEDRPAPVNVPNDTNDTNDTNDATFTQLTAGEDHTCGLNEEGKAFCWGQNANGQLGNGDSDGTEAEPVVVKAPNDTNDTNDTNSTTFVQLAAGEEHTCALDDDGGAWCWGRGANGALGNDNDDRETTPVAVAAPQSEGDPVSFEQLAAGNQHTCGLAQDGDAYCWGATNGPPVEVVGR